MLEDEEEDSEQFSIRVELKRKRDLPQDRQAYYVEEYSLPRAIDYSLGSINFQPAKDTSILRESAIYFPSSQSNNPQQENKRPLVLQTLDSNLNISLIDRRNSSMAPSNQGKLHNRQ